MGTTNRRTHKLNSQENKPQTQKQPILALFCRPTKHPVSIALSNRILQKIGQEATRQRRSRSEYVELHFENLFLESPKPESAITAKTQQT
jgi:hypothetical protein